jgi:hypothetical protein
MVDDKSSIEPQCGLWHKPTLHQFGQASTARIKTTTMDRLTIFDISSRQFYSSRPSHARIKSKSFVLMRGWIHCIFVRAEFVRWINV